MLFRRTVDGIVADIHNKIDQLGDLCNDFRDRAKSRRELAQSYENEAHSLEREANRAAGVAGKLKQLIA